ncbi:MAG TPA: hypothetical protein VF228_14020 [Iamia sp.]
MPDDPTPAPIPPPPAPPAAAAAPATPPSRRSLAWIAIGAVALGVAGGGAAAVAVTGGGEPDRLAVATAAEDETTPPEDGAAADGECVVRGEHRRPGAHGTVTGVDGTTVTIEDDEGTATTVTTDDETGVFDVAEGEVADIAEGDSVVVMGETGDDDAVTARHVTDLGSLDPDALHPGRPDGVEPPAGEEGGDEGQEEGETRHRAFRPTVGTVASVDGATVTVTTDDGDVVVTTTDDTMVTVVTEIAVSDLAEGDTVAARGEVDDEGTVAADVVIRGELDGGRAGFGGPGFGPGRPGGPGGGGGGERPAGPPEGAPDAPDDEGTTTTTEA